MEKSKLIFGNEISSRAYKKAVKSKKKFIRKFGDDTNVNYPVYIQKNPYIGDSLGVNNMVNLAVIHIMIQSRVLM